MECYPDVGNDRSQIYPVLQRYSSDHWAFSSTAHHSANVVFGQPSEVEGTTKWDRGELFLSLQSEMCTWCGIDYSINS